LSDPRIKRTAKSALGDGTFTVGGWWVVPRTRALRPIPSTDPDFAALYGVRNDTESKHQVMKSVLLNKRLHVVGINRVRLHMHAWQLAVTLGAALAWHERTGGDISHLFAHPPPIADAA
jgi:hypothetical protein